MKPVRKRVLAAYLEMGFVSGQLYSGHQFQALTMVDKGNTFTSKFLNLGAYRKKLELAFSRPGKPAGNAFIEQSI